MGNGVIALSILYLYLTAPITSSTCIRTLASLWVASTSPGVSWDFPLVKAGVFRVAPMHYKATLSSTLNPWSASITSPDWSLLRYPQFSVMYLSDVRPPYPFDTKLTVPCGVMLIKYTWLCCDAYKRTMLLPWTLRFLIEQFKAVDDRYDS